MSDPNGPTVPIITLEQQPAPISVPIPTSATAQSIASVPATALAPPPGPAIVTMAPAQAIAITAPAQAISVSASKPPATAPAPAPAAPTSSPPVSSSTDSATKRREHEDQRKAGLVPISKLLLTHETTAPPKIGTLSWLPIGIIRGSARLWALKNPACAPLIEIRVGTHSDEKKGDDGWIKLVAEDRDRASADSKPSNAKESPDIYLKFMAGWKPSSSAIPGPAIVALKLFSSDNNIAGPGFTRLPNELNPGLGVKEYLAFKTRASQKALDDGGYKIGVVIDCLDTEKYWRVAKIAQINDADETVFVQYEGWESKWDEWISKNSPRLAPQGTKVTGFTGNASTIKNNPWQVDDHIDEINANLQKLEPIATMLYRRTGENNLQLRAIHAASRAEITASLAQVQALDDASDNKDALVTDTKAAATVSKGRKITISDPRVDARVKEIWHQQTRQIRNLAPSMDLTTVLNDNERAFLFVEENLTIVMNILNGKIRDDSCFSLCQRVIQRNLDVVIYALWFATEIKPACGHLLSLLLRADPHLVRYYDNYGDVSSAKRNMALRNRCRALAWCEPPFGSIARSVSDPRMIEFDKAAIARRELSTADATTIDRYSPWPYPAEGRGVLNCFLGANLEYFGIFGGFDALALRFNEPCLNLPKDGVNAAITLIRIFHSFRDCLAPDFFAALFPKMALGHPLMERVGRATDTEFKNIMPNFASLIATRQQICDIMVKANVSTSSINEFVDRLRLMYIRRQWQSTSLLTRRAGAVMFLDILSECQKTHRSTVAGAPLWLKSPFLAEWLIANEVLKMFLQPTTVHEGTMAAVGEIMKFLAIQNRLTVPDIDLLWSVCLSHGDLMDRTTLNVLVEMAPSLNASLVRAVTRHALQRPSFTLRDFHFRFAKDFAMAAASVTDDTKIGTLPASDTKSSPSPASDAKSPSEQNEPPIAGAVLMLWNALTDPELIRNRTYAAAASQFVELLAHPPFTILLDGYAARCAKLLGHWKFEANHNKNKEATDLTAYLAASAGTGVVRLVIERIWTETNDCHKYKIESISCRNKMVQEFDAKHKLIDSAIGDLVHLSQVLPPESQITEPPPPISVVGRIGSGIALDGCGATSKWIPGSHEWCIASRFEFLRFLVWGLDPPMTSDQYQFLWKHWGAADCDRTLCFLTECLTRISVDRTQKEPSAAAVEMSDFLLRHVSSADPTRLTVGTWTCIRQLFLHVNHYRYKSLWAGPRIDPVLLGNLPAVVGLDTMWTFLASAPKPIATLIGVFLAHLHTRSGYEVPIENCFPPLQSLVARSANLAEMAVAALSCTLGSTDITQDAKIAQEICCRRTQDAKIAQEICCRRLHALESVLGVAIEVMQRPDWIPIPCRFVVNGAKQTIMARWYSYIESGDSRESSSYNADVIGHNPDGTMVVKFSDGDVDTNCPLSLLLNNQFMTPISKETVERTATITKYLVDCVESNKPLFDALLSLLRSPINSVSSMAMRILQRIPVMDSLHTRILSTAPRPAGDWATLLPAGYALLITYTLRIIRTIVTDAKAPAPSGPSPASAISLASVIPSAPASASAVSNEWCAAFAKSEGPAQLLACLLHTSPTDFISSPSAINGLIHLLELIWMFLTSAEHRATFLQSFGDTVPLANRLVALVAAVVSSPLPRRISGPTYDEQIAATIGSLVDRIMTVLSHLSSSSNNANLFKGQEREWTTIFERGLLHEAKTIRYGLAGKISTLVAGWSVDVVSAVLASLLPLIHRLHPNASNTCGPLFSVTREAFKTFRLRTKEMPNEAAANTKVKTWEAENASAFIECIALKLRNHPILERSSNGAPSDTMLWSMISLANLIITTHPQLKIVAAELGITDSVCRALFALPGDTNSSPSAPAAKMAITRTEATNLLLALIRDCPPNLHILFSYFNPLLQEAQNDHAHMLDWNYAAPPLIERVGGNIGLKNARFLCYMNSALQLIYMMPELRQSILRADMGPLTRSAAPSPLPRFSAARSAENVKNGKEGKDGKDGKDGKESDTKKVEDALQLSPIYQLQRLFAHLQSSDAAYVDPQCFVSTQRQPNGQPINPNIQEESSGFYQNLLALLEELLKGTPDAESVARTLRWKSVYRKIGHKGCNHISEREDVSCGAIPVTVDGKPSLEAGLMDFIAPETLQDPIMCAGCRAKVAVVRRPYIKELPDTIVFNLKRFKVDFSTGQTQKLNTRFTFPLTIDMTPYCDEREGVSPGHTFIDEQGKESPRTTTDGKERGARMEYELTGITIHSGTLDGGHYFCKVRVPGNMWVEMNDMQTPKAFSMEQLADECFGGEYKAGATSFLRSSNAVMLVYRRRTAPSIDTALAPVIEDMYANISPRLVADVREFNRRCRRDNIMFDPTIAKFVYSLLCSKSALPSVSPQPGSTSIVLDPKVQAGNEDDAFLLDQMIIRFMLNHLFRSSIGNGNVKLEWMKWIRPRMEGNRRLAEWFLDEAFTQWAITYLNSDFGGIAAKHHHTDLGDSERGHHFVDLMVLAIGSLEKLPTVPSKLQQVAPMYLAVRNVIALTQRAFTIATSVRCPELGRLILYVAELGEAEAQLMIPDILPLLMKTIMHVGIADVFVLAFLPATLRLLMCTDLRKTGPMEGTVIVGGITSVDSGKTAPPPDVKKEQSSLGKEQPLLGKEQSKIVKSSKSKLEEAITTATTTDFIRRVIFYANEPPFREWIGQYLLHLAKTTDTGPYMITAAIVTSLNENEYLDCENAWNFVFAMLCLQNRNVTSNMMHQLKQVADQNVHYWKFTEVLIEKILCIASEVPGVTAPGLYGTLESWLKKYPVPPSLPKFGAYDTRGFTHGAAVANYPRSDLIRLFKPSFEESITKRSAYDDHKMLYSSSAYSWRPGETFQMSSEASRAEASAHMPYGRDIATKLEHLRILAEGGVIPGPGGEDRAALTYLFDAERHPMRHARHDKVSVCFSGAAKPYRDAIVVQAWENGRRFEVHFGQKELFPSFHVVSYDHEKLVESKSLALSREYARSNLRGEVGGELDGLGLEEGNRNEGKSNAGVAVGLSGPPVLPEMHSHFT